MQIQKVESLDIHELNDTLIEYLLTLCAICGHLCSGNRDQVTVSVTSIESQVTYSHHILAIDY
jgi:hypothetical protein